MTGVRHDALREVLIGLGHDRDSGRDPGTRLVNACVEVLEVTGAGITLMVDDENRGSLGASDAAIRVVEDLQFALGEGPCVDTYRSGLPVLEPRLADPAHTRWPQFSGPAVSAGVQAIFGFPLVAGTVAIGALDVYSDRPGDLLPLQVSDALIMADLVTRTVLESQADALPGLLAPQLGDALHVRTAVHQATGMLSVQLDLSLADALACLRAYAFADGRAINDVARAVVERRLHID